RRALFGPSSPFSASTTAKPSPANRAVVIVRVHGSSSITRTVFWPDVSTVMTIPSQAHGPSRDGPHEKGNIPVGACQGGFGGTSVIGGSPTRRRRPRRGPA